MYFHIITLFPEAFWSFLSQSIIWNAKEKWLFDVTFYDLKQYVDGKYERVDDKAYGMHGQVLRPDILAKPLDEILKKTGKNIPIVYFSPRGKKLTQSWIEKIAHHTKQHDIVLICGHYEWIDERIIDKYVTKMISIGDYVLSGWELPAQVFIDALVRHIPLVLWNEQSLLEESFSKKLSRKKEYPVYTRPRVFEWQFVPSVLVSWNHKEIEKWKQKNLT